MRRREGLATVALLVGLAVRLAFDVRALARVEPGRGCAEESDFHVEPGDALLHGVPVERVALAMPFYSVPNAVVCDHLSSGAAAAVRSAAVLAGAALVLALGTFLFSAPCGAGAALVYACLPSSSDVGERWLYCLAVLFVAYFLVRRTRAPSWRGTALLGAACGASLLVLSPLFLFPLLLVLVEWRRNRGGPARLRDTAALLVIPFLFLIPWAFMNWRLTGRLVLFEDGRADNNIITGALGYVRTMGTGDARALAGVPAGQSALAWALGEVARHPLRFLGAFVARLYAAAALHPVLAAAAPVSVWLSRRREDCRQLALLAAYFAAIHCLMPVQKDYFDPLWPLLAVLAAGLAAPLTRRAPARTEALIAPLAGTAFALMLAAQFLVLVLVAAYPARAANAGALDRALVSDPGDPWLWSRRGIRRLNEGDSAGAVQDFARAYELDPQADRRTRRDWALLISGGPGARVWAAAPSGTGRMYLRSCVLRAIYLAREGRSLEASSELKTARAAERAADTVTSDLPQTVVEVVASWPAPLRPALVESLLGIPDLFHTIEDGPGMNGDDGFVRMYLRGSVLRAIRLSGEGRRAEASSTLEAARAAARSAGSATSGLPRAVVEAVASAPAPQRSGLVEDLVRIPRFFWMFEDGLPSKGEVLATLASEMDDPDHALAVMKRAALARPGDAFRFIDLAVRAAKGKRRGTARESLLLAERLLGPGAGPAAWLARAEVSAALGDREEARAAADRARAGVLDEGELRRLSYVYQEAGRNALALDVANARVRALPGDARWRNDRGVLRGLRGDLDGAADDFKSAISLDPGLLEAYFSLGSLQASRGRREEALATFAAALSRPRRDGDEEIAGSLLAERHRLATQSR
ncbi:MAG TPA: tetratricopeptide repeat protein [Elusimicrobiota bacterium]|nr:tetratricopeptide repeat protein [Elusimicrobiota bacterium]